MTSDPTDVAAAAPGVEKASVLEDFIDIVYAPAKVFARRARGQYGLALLLVTLLGIGAGAASRGPLRPVREAMVERQIAQALAARPDIPPAQVERIRSMGGMVDRVWFVVLAVSIPFGAFVLGLLIWVASKAVGAATTLGAAIMISTYAMIPRVVIDVFLQGLQAAFLLPATALKGPSSASLSVARVLDPVTTAPRLLRLATQLDVFVLWSMVLVAIGIHVAGRTTKTRGAIAAAGLWALSALILVLTAR